MKLRTDKLAVSVYARHYRQRLMKGREHDQDHCLKVSLLSDEQIIQREIAHARLIADQADQAEHAALLAIYEKQRQSPKRETNTTPLEQLFADALKAIESREATARHIMDRVRGSK
jgi:hypothetical protein